MHMGESLPGARVSDRLSRTRGLGEGRLAPRMREPGGTKRERGAPSRGCSPGDTARWNGVDLEMELLEVG